MKFTTERVYEGYIKVNSSGKQWLVDRDYTTLRENGRVDSSLYYMSKGVGYYEHDGKTYLCPEGSLIFYPPNIRHHYFFKKEDMTELCWSHFSGTLCEQLITHSQGAPVVIKIADRKRFESVFEKMIYAYYNKHTRGEMLCDGYMHVMTALINESLSLTNDTGKKNNAPELEKVLSYMHIYFNNPIDIKKYADMCHQSEDRFIRNFKKQMGYTPYHYQLKVRIEKAVEMLENTGVNVSECAEATGFSDNAYFSRIFKKFTGHPPSYYKK